MKALLIISLISVSLFACSGINEKSENDTDSENALTDSLISNPDNNNAAAPESAADETTRQIMAALFASKQEINTLQSEISDSLTKSGLAPARRSLFSKTIDELETSSKLINKQIEQIVITDLQTNKGKLAEIISKMRVSEQGLGGMIAKLDKITSYMQIASTLMQALVPLRTNVSHSKER